jgi:phospholipid/cholesterol/gamma-HCH transport system ATP-binding protein
MNSSMRRDSQARSESAPHVRVRELSVRFGGHQVLRDIGFEIPRGQTLAVIGESGCGKTMLLKAIIGLVRPTAGSAQINGDDLYELSDRDLAEQRRRFGFLFQQAALFDSMTVEQNVAFPLIQHSPHKSESIQTIVRGRLAQVGLSEAVLPKKPSELSGGMRKRVGLARALAMNPEIMLYDEPTTGLDPIMSDVINELILRTRERDRVTSIVVTHDMRTVQRVADRVLMLCPLSRLKPDEPQAIFDGTPKEIQQSRDPRVAQFVRGEAGSRLTEIAEDA